MPRRGARRPVPIDFEMCRSRLTPPMSVARKRNASSDYAGFGRVIKKAVPPTSATPSNAASRYIHQLEELLAGTILAVGGCFVVDDPRTAPVGEGEGAAAVAFAVADGIAVAVAKFSETART